MLTVSMGLRQSLGICMPMVTRDTGISVADFTLAIAVQNLIWGVLQPVVGAWSVRIGMRRLMVGGALLYSVGLVLLATASGFASIMLGAGIAIGAALACTGNALGMAAASRPVPEALRSAVLGMVSAAGSLGAMLAAPIGQALARSQGWRIGVWGFVLLSLIMGFLWLGVVPLVTGWIVETFGLRWQAMLGGVAFVGHQVGSFVGAYGGGVLYDLTGSYTSAWQAGVAMGLAAGIVQMLFAFLKSSGRPPAPVVAG